jgi:hypothetical protein
MFKLVNKDGQPLKLDIKSAVLVAALGLGVFTVGASFPDLNPLNLVEMGCSSE